MTSRTWNASAPLARCGRLVTLDVALDEDQTRSRKDHAPANLAVLRRLALNIARAHPDTKSSLRGKLKRRRLTGSRLIVCKRYRESVGAIRRAAGPTVLRVGC
jgi:hypothetical protein